MHQWMFKPILLRLVPSRFTKGPKSRRCNNRGWIKTRFINWEVVWEPEGWSKVHVSVWEEWRGRWLIRVPVWDKIHKMIGYRLLNPGGCLGTQRSWVHSGVSRQVCVAGRWDWRIMVAQGGTVSKARISFYKDNTGNSCITTVGSKIICQSVVVPAGP